MLTSLEAYGSDVADLTGLEHAVSLATLDLSYNDIADLTPIAELTALEYLRLASNDIVDVAPLAALTALTELRLSDNRIADIHALSDLTRLVELYLDRNEIVDVAPLAGLVALTKLHLSDNRIADIHALSDLTRLEELYLHRNQIVDVDPLAGLGALRDLRLSDNRVADVHGLSDLGLLRLDLDRNEIVDIRPLGTLGALTALNLSDNRIGDVHGLSGVGLSRLYLGRNGIVDVSPLGTLATLRVLDLSDNRVTDVHGLSDLTTLANLDLGRNAIVDVTPLAHLSELTTLDVSGNLVADASSLWSLVGLRTLRLAGNRLSNVDGVAGLGRLRRLDLARNAIMDASAMRGLAGLETLDLGGNRITDLTPIGTLESLRNLDVEANEIADTGPLAELAIEHLYLGGNAIVDLGPLAWSAGRPSFGKSASGATRSTRVARSSDLGALRGRGVEIVGGGRRVPLFAHAPDGSRQGFVRIVNLSDADAEAWVYAPGLGAGVRPVGVRVGPQEATHFNASDLVAGNPGKGVYGQLPIGSDEALDVFSSMDQRVYAYMRTGDGFLTGMHDTVPAPAGHRVPIFNPASNTRQVSLLRLMNTSANEAAVSVTGVDDVGTPGGSVSLMLPAQGIRTLSAAELESGEADGLAGSLGDGEGKWRLVVSSDRELVAMNLLDSPTGHLTNLSTNSPDNTVVLFPSASHPMRQGFVRIVNHGDAAADARIRGFDNAGTAFGPVTVGVEPQGAVHFNSEDWEAGNAAKGLAEGVGPGDGDWRLEVEGTDLEVLAYVRTRDGFLTSMHDRVESSCAGRELGAGLGALGCFFALLAGLDFHPVAVFNPASNTRQVSSLRLVNVGDGEAAVAIAGIDDHGARAGPVELVLGAGAARTITSQELERGTEGLDGALGDGAGKWELLIAVANGPVHVVNLLESPSGHLTNLSTAPDAVLRESYSGGTAGL